MKTEVLNYLLDINDKNINGEINPLHTYIDLKSIESCLKNVLDGLKEGAINEAEKYGKGEHDVHGAKIQVKNGATRYDFKSVSDHAKALAIVKSIEEERKALIKSGQKEVYNADGELLELPIVKYSATSVSVKL